MLLSPKRTMRVLERWRVDRPFLSEESGMSLVEILVAVFILAVAVIAIASTAAASLQSLRESRERQDATQFASTVLEEIRALPFSKVALDDDTIDLSVEDEFDGELILAAEGGEVDHVRTNGNQTATTYITVIPGTDGEELRATVLVTWGDIDGEHTVRQETRIAEATRGLPVPSFTVSPTEDEATGLERETICIDHTLSNLGEQDAYSWQLWSTRESDGTLEPGDYQTRTVNEPDGSGGTQSVTREGFKIKSSSEGKNWFGWALMAIPASSSTFEPMTDETGDQRPDSPGTVQALGDAEIRFCYTPLNQSGVLEAESTSPTFTPRIYSAFDETINTQSQGNELSNTLNVISGTVLYLHEVEGSSSKTMSTADPQFTDENLDYDDPADGVPGLHLSVPFDPTTWAANADELALSLPRELANPAVTLHVLTSDDDPDQDLTFTIRLLHEDGDTSTDPVVASTTVTVPSVTTDPQAVGVDLSLTRSVIVETGHTLSVEIGCDETNSDDECHVHYDVTTLDSHFSGVFQ